MSRISPYNINWQNPINWRNGLNRELLHFWMAAPHSAGGTTLVDLCQRTNGTLTNMSLTSSWTNTSNGWSALNFDDTDDYVFIRNGTTIATMDNCTISVWFRTTNTSKVGGWSLYSERAASGNDIFKLDYGDSGAGSESEPFLTWRNDAGTLTRLRFGTIPLASDGQWHHLVLRIAGAFAILYYDVDYSVSINLGGTKTFTDTGLETRIGVDKADVNANWGGEIGPIQVWSRALHPPEIFALNREGKMGFPNILTTIPKRRIVVSQDVGGGGGGSPGFILDSLSLNLYPVLSRQRSRHDKR